MHIPRALEETIIEELKKGGKAIILYGPRQAGKTTLVKTAISGLGYRTLTVNADQLKYVDVLSSRDLDKLKALVSGFELLFIDEAQRVPEIGINLKLMIDEIPGLKIIATGSSSFDLANKISEPLTGRAWTHVLYPLAFYELKKYYQNNTFKLDGKLEEALIFGGYPEVFTTVSSRGKQTLLEEISRSYLYKDVLELATVKHAAKIRDILKLLAFQIGSEVSVLELSNSLDLSRDAVERYLDLLEKAYVIFRLKGFSRNLRKEVSKMDKIYFYDLGIRNAIIDNFKYLKDRDDAGRLWENFLMAERAKYLAYTRTFAATYFWRTHTGAELDYVEESGGQLNGYEFKIKGGKIKLGGSWLKTYPDAKIKLIDKNNYLKFIA